MPGRNWLRGGSFDFRTFNETSAAKKLSFAGYNDYSAKSPLILCPFLAYACYLAKGKDDAAFPPFVYYPPIHAVVLCKGLSPHAVLTIAATALGSMGNTGTPG